MRNIVSIIFALITIGSCSQEKEPNYAPSDALIRVRNQIPTDINDLVIGAGFSINDYGFLKFNEISEYKFFQNAWQTLSISLSSDGSKYEIVPFDLDEQLEGKYIVKIYLDSAFSNPLRYDLTKE